MLRRLSAVLDVPPRQLVRLCDEELTVRDLRAHVGLSMSEVATTIGYKSPTSYGEIESGHRRPTPGHLAKIASVLEVERELLEIILVRTWKTSK